ncbi:MAG: chemotaxis protein CheV [Firmicutes bacterium HGW-Firmicutes-16]|nr:MAG: chemotaxis protein CheV [Firmicutes bacterium HGW-Firmicutes-16]
MNESRQPEILLESGINELEIMEFTIGSQLFGINVAKVREIMKIETLVHIQKSNEYIEGIFKPRDKVLTVINLPAFLGLAEAEKPERDIFIIAGFNNSEYAFHVHTVVGIDRISCAQMKKPDPVIFGGKEGVATGIVEHEKKLITIIDFEAIITEICPEKGLNILKISDLGSISRNDKHILVVEDSLLLSKMIIESLHKAGYIQTVKLDNGQEAWDYLCELRDSENNIDSSLSCIITDIEMPLMDGHRLTKLVKTDKKLKHIPLVIFSSLISEEMRIKGKELGADEQITKPEIGQLVDIIDSLTK